MNESKKRKTKSERNTANNDQKRKTKNLTLQDTF